MSHNATHTMDKEHGAAASSLWTIVAALALPLIFNALLEQSQSALVNYVNAWGNWLAGLVDGEQVSRVVERVEVFDRNGYGCGGGADDEAAIRGLAPDLGAMTANVVATAPAPAT